MRRTRQSLRYGASQLGNAPILFANSFPKSGTHLLTQVLKGFTHIGPAVDSGLPAIVTFEGDSGRQRPEAEIVRDLQRLLPSDIGYGHVHALEGAVSFLCRDGVAAYFILRDPRDVVVSHAHYITDMKADHIHHRYYQEALKNFDQRLQASIEGASGVLPNVRERFEPYMGWLDHPEVLALRYEDFILGRQEAIGQVFDHAIARGFKAACGRRTAIQILSESIDPARSPTFRSGKIGGWRDSFTDQHKQLFKEVTSNLLLRLGYERDNDW
ncbi:MAG: sulfotransferase domain-containing protein [Anaerolineales bacterium]|nr:sulfotransferase domain-containing protein [Anaerolineales bacterium]